MRCEERGEEVEGVEMKVKPKVKYRPEFTQKDRQACRAVMAWTLDKDKALSRVTSGRR